MGRQPRPGSPAGNRLAGRRGDDASAYLNKTTAATRPNHPVDLACELEVTFSQKSNPPSKACQAGDLGFAVPTQICAR